MTLIEKFYEHLQTHETLQAAQIEAVHRFYFDHCFDEKTKRPFGTKDQETINNLLTTLHCNLPDWRYRIIKNMQRYGATYEPTNALCLSSKPTKIIALKSDYLIT